MSVPKTKLPLNNSKQNQTKKHQKQTNIKKKMLEFYETFALKFLKVELKGTKKINF